MSILTTILFLFFYVCVSNCHNEVFNKNKTNSIIYHFLPLNLFTFDIEKNSSHQKQNKIKEENLKYVISILANQNNQKLLFKIFDPHNKKIRKFNDRDNQTLTFTFSYWYSHRWISMNQASFQFPLRVYLYKRRFMY